MGMNPVMAGLTNGEPIPGYIKLLADAPIDVMDLAAGRFLADFAGRVLKEVSLRQLGV